MNHETETDIDRHATVGGSGLIDSVPVIDLQGLVQGDGIDKKHSAITEIAEASHRWGFFQVVNHGIADEHLDRIWNQTHRFFSRPQADKDTLQRTLDNPWGYYNNELTKNQRDKKEVFDFTSPGEDPIYHGANRWPDDESFRQVMHDHFAICTRLSRHLLQAFCVGLNLPPDFLRNEFSPEQTSFIRLNYYPVGDPLLGTGKEHEAVAALGIHNHTDAGALTVLLQDEVGGLQVYHDGQWHGVPVVEGALVINTGDMMQVWSNDEYQAAVHRVLAMTDVQRFSIPYFFNPSATTKVAPLPSIVSDDRPQLYSEIDWAKFRGSRSDGDFANYGTEVQISQYRL